MSKFTILGHPAHPMLVALPIGFCVATFASDIAYLATGKDKTWYDAATWAGAAATATGLVAAFPGFGDYLTMRMGNQSRLVATLHMVCNLGLVALFGVAFLLMIDDGAIGGSRYAAVFVMHTVGIGLLSLAGWLGGELVYKHGLAVGDRIDRDETIVSRERRGVAAGHQS